MTNPTHTARIAALLPLTVCGPSYNRGVTEALADVRLFTSRSWPEAAEHNLLMAELAAGLITWDDVDARDPFHQSVA